MDSGATDANFAGTFYSDAGRINTGAANPVLCSTDPSRLAASVLLLLFLTDVKASLSAGCDIVNGHSHCPTMANDKQNTQIRQEQIATAALQIIGRHGTRALSVARIARSVGLVPSAIYRHFGGKDEVIDAVLDLIRSNLQANVVAAATEAENPLDALRRLVNLHIKFLCTNDGVSTLIFSDQVYSGPKKRKAKIYGVIKDYLQGISKFVRDGQDKGFIRSELDSNAVAVMFLGLVQSPTILWHLSEGNFGVQSQSGQAWQVFERAIRRH